MNLKPCPFCGGKEVRVTQHGGFGVNCICGGMFYDNADTAEEVIKAWNKRANKWINTKDELPKKTDKYLAKIIINEGEEDEFIDVVVIHFFANWKQFKPKWKWINNLQPIAWMAIPGED